MKKISKAISSRSLQEGFKVSDKDFTRTRKQSFSSTVLFMLNLLTKSLSIEIQNFVAHIQGECGVNNFKSFTKSAFV